MKDFSNTIKTFLNRSAKFIGRTFNTAATETKYKANEISISNKRRELITELGKKVFELSSNGVQLPQEAADLVDQINKLDNDLQVLQTNHATQKAAVAEQHAMEKAARAAEKAAAKATAAIEQTTAAVDIDIPATEAAVDDAAEIPVSPVLDIETKNNNVDENKNDVPTLNV